MVLSCPLVVESLATPQYNAVLYFSSIAHQTGWNHSSSDSMGALLLTVPKTWKQSSIFEYFFDCIPLVGGYPHVKKKMQKLSD